MPFKSRQQQKYAFATKKPWADEWASETDFNSLPERKGKKKMPKKGKKAAKGAMPKGKHMMDGMIMDDEEMMEEPMMEAPKPKKATKKGKSAKGKVPKGKKPAPKKKGKTFPRQPAIGW